MITDNKRDISVIYMILKCCDNVNSTLERFGKSIDIFENDEIYVNAVSMPIMQIGELTKHLSDEFKAAHTDVPWQIIHGMRNWFAHNYFEMNIMEIWEVAVEDIPVLAGFCEKILDGKGTDVP